MMMMMVGALAFSSAIFSYASFLWPQVIIHFLRYISLSVHVSSAISVISAGATTLVIYYFLYWQPDGVTVRKQRLQLLLFWSCRVSWVSSSDHVIVVPPHERRWHRASCLYLNLWSSAIVGLAEGNGIIIITMWLSIASCCSAAWCNWRVLKTVGTVGINRAQTNCREPSLWLWHSY